MTPSLRISQFLRMDPSKSLSSGALSLMSLHSSRTLTLPTSLQMFYSSSVELPRTSGLMPAMMLCPTMKIILKLASMQCGLPSLSTMQHLTKLPKDYETLNERPRNQQIWNSMILRHKSTSLISTYLYSQEWPHGHCLEDADMFDTVQKCVPDWNNSFIASNTMTKNINDLLEYYGKLEQQEARRNPKTRCQDNSNSQQQPTRNQNQCHSPQWRVLLLLPSALQTFRCQIQKE